MKRIKTLLRKYKWIKQMYVYLVIKFLMAKIIFYRLQKKQIVHFLHIRKTGGSSIKYALEPFSVTSKRFLALHHHNVKLHDIPIGEKFFFFIRDPLDRFVSGFYSRQREDKPRYTIPWNERERKAFNRFKTANALAESLSSNDVGLKNAATEAMRNINHINTFYWNWFENKKYFISRLSDLLFIGELETINHNFNKLKNFLEINKLAILPKDEINMHKNPKSVNKFLSLEAKKNLKKWYAEDYRFLKLLKAKKL